MKLGTIYRSNPSGEQIDIEYDEVKCVYVVSSGESKKITLSEEEMRKLYELLDGINNYK